MSTPKFLQQALIPKLSAVLLAGVAAIGSAQALTLKSHSLNGAVLDSSFSTSSLIALDLSFFSAQPVSLEFEVEAADVGATLAFNAVLKAVGGSDFLSDLHLQLNRGVNWVTGSAYSLKGSDLPVFAVDGSAAHAGLSSAGLNDIYLGNPFGEGKTDWQLQLGGLQQGDRFVMNISQVSPVPEPTTAAILALGLAALFLLNRSRDR
ncbi:PEP-CTERM sorting domain-containing protein [Roseateles sp.]|uniref:PEP-CTERM sorting domain-containing protein n=1 Tax=Roseateles sp. TaxID=1971397 RepID=UPI003BA4B3D8